jgi:hypothetical protein
MTTNDVDLLRRRYVSLHVFDNILSSRFPYNQSWVSSQINELSKIGEAPSLFTKDEAKNVSVGDYVLFYNSSSNFYDHSFPCNTHDWYRIYSINSPTPPTNICTITIPSDLFQSVTLMRSNMPQFQNLQDFSNYQRNMCNALNNFFYNPQEDLLNFGEKPSRNEIDLILSNPTLTKQELDEMGIFSSDVIYDMLMGLGDDFEHITYLVLESLSDFLVKCTLDKSVEKLVMWTDCGILGFNKEMMFLQGSFSDLFTEAHKLICHNKTSGIIIYTLEGELQQTLSPDRYCNSLAPVSESQEEEMMVPKSPTTIEEEEMSPTSSSSMQSDILFD